jgi:hypothetical protein
MTVSYNIKLGLEKSIPIFTYSAVLFDALQIPAGMTGIHRNKTGIHWNPPEWDQNPLAFVVYKQTL